MAKIGTAHIEIKPVLNDDALKAIAARIETAVQASIAEATGEGVVFGQEGEALPLGAGPFYLPDALGTIREFRVAQCHLKRRNGKPFTTYTLTQPDHFAEGPGSETRPA